MAIKSESSVPYLFHAIRLFKGKNISALSDTIGVSRQSVHAWKRGANPNFNHVVKAAWYLGMSSDAFSDLSKFCDFLSQLNSSDEKVYAERLEQMKKELCKC